MCDSRLQRWVKAFRIPTRTWSCTGRDAKELTGQPHCEEKWLAPLAGVDHPAFVLIDLGFCVLLEGQHHEDSLLPTAIPSLRTTFASG